MFAVLEMLCYNGIRSRFHNGGKRGRRLKKRFGLLIVALLVIASLFLPGLKLYVHSQLGEETAALFPGSISIWQMATRGADSLPTGQVRALSLVNFSGWMVLAAALLLLASAVLSLSENRKLNGTGIVLAGASLALSATFAIHVNNLASSLMFQLLFTAQAWIYAPVGGAVVALVYEAILLRGSKEERAKLSLSGQRPPLLDERTWRTLMGVAAAVALVLMLLPVYSIKAPSTLTDDPADAAAISRSTPLVAAALGRDPMLNSYKAEGRFSNVISGDIAQLVPFSGDENNIRGIFQIPRESGTLAANPSLIAAAALLALTLLLSFIRPVDKWFPTSLAVLATIALGASLLGTLTIGSADMYTGASRQALHLGLGTLTPFAALATLAAALSMVCGVLCIRAADAPYFVNPIPKHSQIRLVAVTLAVLSVACILLPGASLSFYNPGKNKVGATRTLSGLEALKLSVPEKISQPVSDKGKTLYGETEKEGVMNAGQVADAMNALTRTFGLLTWAALILTAAGVVTVLMARRKAAIALFIAAFALRVLAWITLMTSMPQTLGTASGTLYLYLSLPLLLFAAFFANNAQEETLPKKYKLFLMMLPFLVAVFLFAYLPLYGWSYAFFNYKFGLPLNQQEFVGLKWFTEMFTNPANRDNIVRVLKNTFGMSGLNLVTSWMPMIFAVFLNEITRTRFKKAVQIFTTLPNFISWALVFSFAMCMFAMDTGIFSKFMLAIGAIDEPVVWLNSSSHIWLKMWGWSTWKGLGWGAIMYLAAISGIPVELYEAARVDGANRWHQMRYITLPSLLPTFFVLLMLSISNILNNGMEQYLVFQNPMNKQTIEVLDLYVYNATIASGGTTLYSFATAIGILKTIVSVTLLFSANFVSKKLRGESIV